MDKAERSFSQFVEVHPASDLTDNALYWWGECRYHKKDYIGALRIFQRVIEEQPGGNKVPDAMVKMGLSLVNLKQKDEGLQILAQVMVIYPDTTSAQVAEKRRQEILRSK
jgi:tol-pal system protein YbgF